MFYEEPRMGYFCRLFSLTYSLVPATALAIVSLCAQQIIPHPKNSDPLEAKWAWAWREVAGGKLSHGFWVGYGTQRWMSERFFIGSFGDHSGYRDVSLRELLYGQKESLTLSDEGESVRCCGWGVPGTARASPSWRTCKNPQIHREAMFWLGRSDDPRAFDFPVQLVRRKWEHARRAALLAFPFECFYRCLSVECLHPTAICQPIG
jgi:hypothetical protein